MREAGHDMQTQVTRFVSQDLGLVTSNVPCADVLTMTHREPGLDPAGHQPPWLER